MKNILITAALIINFGCGVLMTVDEHREISEKRENEWLTSWNYLKKHSEELDLSIKTYESALAESLEKINLEKETALSIKKRNESLLEKLTFLKKDKNKLQNEINESLAKITSLELLIEALKKDVLRKENEYVSLAKSKKRFRCQSWDCFLVALNGSDSFWDKYASQAEDFLGKSPHRKLLESERKSVLRVWTRGYKSWRGVRRTYFDWTSGDRRKTFVAELGQTYGEDWRSENDFNMTGEIRIEVKTKKDQLFFEQVNNGSWKIIAYVKIKKSPNKYCFSLQKTCMTSWIITKKVKKVVFIPDVEQLSWNTKVRKKVFNSKKFVHVH